MHEFDVVIIEDETGRYVAFVPSLSGCQGKETRWKKLRDNVKEDIELYLDPLTGR